MSIEKKTVTTLQRSVEFNGHLQPTLRVTITIEASDDDSRQRLESRARLFLERELGK